MRFLPIVERELRVAARRSGTYWTRLGLALLATGIGTAIFSITLGMFSPQQTGQGMFRALSGLLLLYCLAYGRRATADCLSLEKREGTLGLLFLTDLKGHDVVLGKLAATSVGGFYSLLAVLPVLSICLLLGGITSGEFWRMALVLVETFLLSLAIGILGSSLTREFRRAMAANFLLLLLVVGAPPAAAGLIGSLSPGHRPILELAYSCPVFTFFVSFDATYVSERAHFWWSAGTIFAVTWLLVLLASWVAPVSWQDQPTRTSRNRWREWWHTWSYGEASQRPPYRKRLLDTNAFYWLAARARLKPVHVWTFLGFMAAWWVIGWATSGDMWLDEAALVLTALMLNFAFKVWVAIEAGQELADDQKSGAVELLLSVPLTVRDILRGQLLALRRQFLKPLLVVMAVEVVFMLMLYQRTPGWEVLVTWLAGLTILTADLAALVWVAMARALTAKNHNQATISTLARVLVLPWVVFGLVVGAGNLWSALTPGPGWSPGWGFYVGLWFGLSLAVDLIFGLWAWWQLQTRFREITLRRFSPTPSRFVQWMERRKLARSAAADRRIDASAGTATKTSPAPGTSTLYGIPTNPRQAASISQAERSAPLAERRDGRPAGRAGKPRWRRRLVAAVVGLTIIGGLGVWLMPRRDLPPAVTVALSSTKGPVRVFPAAAGAFLILPDGSLWRWGQAGSWLSPRIAVPERVGTNDDWVAAAVTGRHCAGLRADGTIWEWGVRGGHLSVEPEQVGNRHDWAGIAVSLTHAVALRQDGTLWAWGQNSSNQLGNGPGPPQDSPVQVGTNHDWVAVCGYFNSTFALRRDGTLWAWGGIVFRSGVGRGMAKNYATPIRVCADTNWVGFVPSTAPLVRNRAGELWDPTFAPADPDAPAASSCRRVAGSGATNHVAVAMTGKPKLYELRPDGSLWESDYTVSGAVATPGNAARRVGKRSDWVSLWSGGGTALGLTADGTLWTWGIDPGREPVFGFSSKVQAVQMRLRAMAGARATGGVAVAALPPFENEPRPLMRLVPAGSSR